MAEKTYVFTSPLSPRNSIGWLGHEKPYSVRHRFVEATGKKNENWNPGDFTSVNSSGG